jgi:predicted membrane channel-forming protein YqfA (hemolysin III family)
MPRWLLGAILGIVTAGLDLITAFREKLSTQNIIIVIVIRIAIGLIIGSPIFHAIPRHLRWLRGVAISLILSIPILFAIPHLWQSILGFGIAYGTIIGYIIDRALPLSSESDRQ